MDERLTDAVELDSPTGLPIGPKVDANPSRWPGAKLLDGQTVRLEALDPGLHEEGLWHAVGGAHNAGLWLYISDGPFEERLDFDVFLHGLKEHDDPAFFTIVNRNSGEPEGWCSFLNIRPKHRAIEVGYLMF